MIVSTRLIQIETSTSAGSVATQQMSLGIPRPVATCLRPMNPCGRVGSQGRASRVDQAKVD